ncbi:MAG TPA: NDP-sugar synthase [Candidatus Binataceae bacterium]|jgi:NDP-sugar pyrophosphorylase family protein|nr:NDP-sugar synthase [Candidatus Binataceae bacterium]
MKALVLAAGKGERLRPLTETIPKPMLELGGRPLIHYPLMMLKRAGITQVAINLHHLAERIETGLGTGRALGLEITYAPETVLLGTGGPLCGLRGFFGSEPFVVANADTVMDLDLPAMIELHRARGALATFALHRPANISAYSHLEIDHDGRLRRIRLLTGRDGVFEDFPEKPPAMSVEAYMFCGLYICEPKVYDMMPPAPPFSSMKDLFAPIIARGQPLFGYVHRGRFYTVDDLATYENLKREFAANPPGLWES